MREPFYNIIESKHTGLVGMLLMLAVLLPASVSAKQLTRGKQLFTDKPHVTVVNDRHIVIGLDDKDKVSIRKTFGLTLSGFKEKKTLDCCAMSAIALTGNEQDTLHSADDITLVNNGVIEIHTKGLVERFKDQMSIPDVKEGEYEYMRLIALCSAGKRNTLINEGTIEIHLDHDPSAPFTIYCYGMASNNGGTFINRGTIAFKGQGSSRVRLRGIGVQGAYASSLNSGTITMDAEITEDCRMITTASDSCNIVNDGIMKGRATGTLMGITRYGSSTIANNGVIDLTWHSLPEGFNWIVAPSLSLVTGFYESVHKERTLISPPLMNKGTVNVSIEGDERTPKFFQGFGMMIHQVAPNRQKMDILNLGHMNLSQTGTRLPMAEVGIITEDKAAAEPCEVVVGQWYTDIRNFDKDGKLFLRRNGNLNLRGATLCLTRPKDYADGTVCNIAPGSIAPAVKAATVGSVTGYEQMRVVAADDQHQRVTVDRNTHTVAMYTLPAKGQQVVNTKPGQTIINDKYIVVGMNANEFCYKQLSNILGHGTGATKAYTLDCTALASINLVGDTHDPAGRTDNVTIVNKGVIELHTKYLVERYKDSIQTEAHPERPYLYLRVNGITAMGEQCSLINEGLIDVYFDHDPATEFTIYSFGMLASDNSSVVNKGEIRFHGNGSESTRLRAIGSMGNNVKCVNDGMMIMDVDLAEDGRMITTGGMHNTIVNNGTMRARGTGCLLGMTRFGDSDITNNGTISLTALKSPEGIKMPLLRAPDRHVCGLYDFVSMLRKDITPLVNHGHIDITIEGADNDYYVGAGMIVDMVAPNDNVIELVNDGTITLHKEAPGYNMAEAAFMDRSAKGATAHVKVGRWITTLRDYATTHNLFLAKSADIDFGSSELTLMPAVGYQEGTAYSFAPANIIYNIGGEKAVNVRGYNTMKVLSGSQQHNVLWDKKAQKLSLKAK